MHPGWNILWYIVAVSFLVIVHEFGHFWVAQRLGFKVLRFSIGFGKPLLRRTVGADQTELVVAPIPLGGYVKMLDEREGQVSAADLPRSFTRRPPWQRILVLFAGPGFNVLFAILVLWVMYWVNGMTIIVPVVGTVTGGSVAARAGLTSGDQILTVDGHPAEDQSDVEFALLESIVGHGTAALQVRSPAGSTRTVTLAVPSPAERHALTEPAALLRGLGFQFRELPIPPIIGEVLADGAAKRAGISPGDRIVAIGDTPIHDFRDVQRTVTAIPGRTVPIQFSRAGRQLTVEVRVGSDTQDGKVVGRIGVGPLPLTQLAQYSPQLVRYVALSPASALGEAASYAWSLTANQAQLLGRMILGQVSLKNLSGPISIAQFAGESAHGGAGTFISFLVLISLAIALFNLLPIPLLDGGQIVFQAAEWVKGSPLSERTQAFGQQVGIALLVLLLGVALFNDVTRQFG